MHTELNIYADLRHRERQRNEHVEQSRLRALSETEASARETLAGRWLASNGALSLLWNLTGLIDCRSNRASPELPNAAINPMSSALIIRPPIVSS